MKSKVVIITGGAGGIGKSLVQYFAASDFHVILLDIHQSAIDQTIAETGSNNVTGFVCDVTKEAQVEEIFHTVFSHYNRIDVLVNRACSETIKPLLHLGCTS